MRKSNTQMLRYALLVIATLLLAESAHAQVTVQVPNAGTTGTTIGSVAKLTGAPSTAVITATTDSDGALGIVIGWTGTTATTGNAIIAIGGQASCTFDGATTAGDYVAISATATSGSPVSGDCHDAGTGFVDGQVIGRVLSTIGSAGAATVQVFPPEIRGIHQQFYLSWAPGQNLAAQPISFLQAGGQGRTVIQLSCRVDGTNTNGVSTIAIYAAGSGTALGSGTKLNTTDCNAAGTANTSQNMGITVSAISPSAWVGIVAAGAGWTSGTPTGSGAIRVVLAPIP